MSNVEWDSKVVIGQKAKAAKVTRNTSDLNGAYQYRHLSLSLSRAGAACSPCARERRDK